LQQRHVSNKRVIELLSNRLSFLLKVEQLPLLRTSAILLLYLQLKNEIAACTALAGEQLGMKVHLP
jgi:hypothetical protein